MHILIIPSEQFVPEHAPLAGIFQFHQAILLQQHGLKIGALSVSQNFSLPMIIKALLFRLVGKKAGNSCDNYPLIGLVSLLYKKIYKPGAFIKTFKRGSIPVVSVEGFYYFKSSQLLHVKGWVKAGMSAFDKYRMLYGEPDVIHAHDSVSAGILARKIKKRYGVNYVITEHSSKWIGNKIKCKKVISYAKDAYQNSALSYAVSCDFASQLNYRFGFNKIKVLPNVIDPLLEHKNLIPQNKKHEKFVFFHLAELKPIKGQISILEAFSIALKQYPKMELRIGGDGIMAEELKDVVVRLGIIEHVRFLGYLDRSEVDKEMSECNCFIMYSIYETFSVVLIEAMLYGKPVIAGNAGGPRDIVTKISGELVETGNPKELAKIILHMVHNIDNYDPVKIREYVIDKFGAERFIERAISAFKQIMS